MLELDHRPLTTEGRRLAFATGVILLCKPFAFPDATKHLFVEVDDLVGSCHFASGAFRVRRRKPRRDLSLSWDTQPSLSTPQYPRRRRGSRKVCSMHGLNLQQPVA